MKQGIVLPLWHCPPKPHPRFPGASLLADGAGVFSDLMAPWKGIWLSFTTSHNASHCESGLEAGVGGCMVGMGPG